MNQMEICHFPWVHILLLRSLNTLHFLRSWSSIILPPPKHSTILAYTHIRQFKPLTQTQSINMAKLMAFLQDLDIKDLDQIQNSTIILTFSQHFFISSKIPCVVHFSIYLFLLYYPSNTVNLVSCLIKLFFILLAYYFMF